MEKVVVVTELHRKRKAVDQLHLKLDSYLCTPQTNTLFEKQASLKTELNRMADNTDELLAILQVHDISIMDNMEAMEKQSAAFNKLHEEVELYVKIARK